MTDSLSVTGLNLDDPLSAGKVIKTWDERLDESEYVESGVDDDVREVSSSPCHIHTPTPWQTFSLRTCS
jgi:hypothetical protein